MPSRRCVSLMGGLPRVLVGIATVVEDLDSGLALWDALSFWERTQCNLASIAGGGPLGVHRCVAFRSPIGDGGWSVKTLRGSLW